MLCGCSGIQKGKFAVSVHGDYPLENEGGSLIKLKGNELDSRYQPVGPEKFLMAVLIICPGTDGRATGGTSADDEFVSWHEFGQGSVGKRVSVRFDWDRRKDVVEIEGSKFDFSSGRVLVVVKEPGGKATIWQFREPNSAPTNADLLAHIKSQLPDNRVVTQVELRKLPGNRQNE